MAVQRFPRISGLLPLAAPTVVALTGMFYLAGWGYQRSILQRFGISAGMFDFSIQYTIALGYVPVLLGTVVVVVVLTLLWLAHRGMMRLTSTLEDNWLGRLNQLGGKVANFNSAMFAALLLLSYAFITAGLMANSSATQVARDVENGCKQKCFTYEVGQTTIKGRMLLQDHSRAAIYSNVGVVIVKNDDLHRITPHRRVSQDFLFPTNFKFKIM